MNIQNKKILSDNIMKINWPIGKAKYLEIGFGLGGNSDQPINIIKAINNGWSIYGIDKSKSVVKKIYTKYRQYHNLYLVHGDVRRGLAYDNNYFDIVAFNDVLDFIMDKEPSEYDVTRYKLFSEITRVLKNTGYLIFKDHTLGAFEFKFSPLESYFQHTIFFKNWEKSLDILNIAEKVGLKQIYSDKSSGSYVFVKP